MSKKIAIVSQAVDAGGVGTLVHFIHNLLADSAEFQPIVISIATSSRDTASVRLTQPQSWQRGVQVESITWQDKQVPHVGANLTELEFMRYQPRAALTEILAECVLVQVVCGSPAVAHVVPNLPQPLCITAASLLEVERRAVLADAPRSRRLWSQAMVSVCRNLEAKALRRADHVFSISDYTTQLMKRHIDDSKLSLTPSGIDTERFHPAETYAEDGHLIAVGRWSDPRKNIRMLFRAYQQMCQTMRVPRLVLVGQARPTDADWAYAQQLGIADCINVFTNVSLDELARLYREASLFLMSSDEEGLGIVILEAMASGLPAISTRSGGPDMLIQDGENGYLIDLDDADGLAQRTCELLAQPATRQMMSQQARDFVLETYSFDKVAADYLNVYRRLLDMDSESS